MIELLIKSARFFIFIHKVSINFLCFFICTIFNIFTLFCTKIKSGKSLLLPDKYVVIASLLNESSRLVYSIFSFSLVAVLVPSGRGCRV